MALSTWRVKTFVPKLHTNNGDVITFDHRTDFPCPERLPIGVTESHDNNSCSTFLDGLRTLSRRRYLRLTSSTLLILPRTGHDPEQQGSAEHGKAHYSERDVIRTGDVIQIAWEESERKKWKVNSKQQGHRQ